MRTNDFFKFLSRAALPALLAATWLVGCSDDDSPVRQLTDEQIAVEEARMPEAEVMSVTIEKTGFDGDNATTRYEPGATAFADGDSIKVVNTTGYGAQGEAWYIYDGSKFTGTLTWNYSTETLYAYRRGDLPAANFNEAHAPLTFKVQSNQSTDVNLRASDFLYSASKNVAYTSGATAQLNAFTHKVAQVKIITKVGSTNTNVTSVTIGNHANQLITDMKVAADGTVTLGSTYGSVLMKQTTTTGNYVAYVPPQSFASIQEKFIDVLYNEKHYYCSLPADANFQMGNTYTLTLTLREHEAAKLIDVATSSDNGKYVFLDKRMYDSKEDAVTYGESLTNLVGCISTVADGVVTMSHDGSNITEFDDNSPIDDNTSTYTYNLVTSLSILISRIDASVDCSAFAGYVVCSNGKIYPTISDAGTDIVVGMIAYFGTSVNSCSHGIIVAESRSATTTWSSSRTHGITSNTWNDVDHTVSGLSTAWNNLTEVEWTTICKSWDASGNYLSSHDGTVSGYNNLNAALNKAGFTATTDYSSSGKFSGKYWSITNNSYRRYFTGTGWNGDYTYDGCGIRPCLAF